MVTLSAKEGYALWAERYDGGWPGAFEEERVIALLRNPQGLTILDAGCGTGRNSIMLCRAGATVYGIDQSPEMILKARSTFSTLGLSCTLNTGTLDKLPYRSGFFDAVLCSAVLDHILDIGPVIKEFSRVLKPTGTVIISGPSPSCDLTIHRAGFTHQTTHYTIEEHPHSYESYDQFARLSNLVRVSTTELGLSEKHRRYYPPDVFEQERTKKIYTIMTFRKRPTPGYSGAH